MPRGWRPFALSVEKRVRVSGRAGSGRMRGRHWQTKGRAGQRPGIAAECLAGTVETKRVADCSYRDTCCSAFLDALDTQFSY